MPETGRPDFEKLADYAEGRLPPDEARLIARRIEEADAETRAEARWLRSFAKVSEGLALDDPPVGVRRDLEAAFVERFVEGKEKSGVIERIVAALNFDSGFQASFGVRSAGTPSSEAQRQLSYGTKAADISVSIQPRPGGLFDLLGQVLPLGDEDPEEFAVQLVGQDETEVAITNADDLGEFSFENVDRGVYRIVVATPEAEILTPTFTL
ncbi:hypothetical protein [Rubrobacter indicoceani]|uniref:hypothetical protein n=1 Tax=Rubrobacter indicoceani TaxID=2051957 RepID=UPI000E5B90FE|nr:hypothetical protein [Rubrobacter indicoceani]